jgi:hypothetical protein
MKRSLLWSATAGAGAVLCAATALHALPSEAATDITVNATTGTAAFAIPCPTCFLHAKPRGAHTGGTEYDGGTLTDLSGNHVGHYVAEETGMTPFNAGPGRVQLVGTIALQGGQLTFQGLEEPPLQGGVVAITGGTGRFVGATGEITYTDVSATITRLVIHLS